jgi:hypothetical protein
MYILHISHYTHHVIINMVLVNPLYPSSSSIASIITQPTAPHICAYIRRAIYVFVSSISFPFATSIPYHTPYHIDLSIIMITITMHLFHSSTHILLSQPIISSTLPNSLHSLTNQSINVLLMFLFV